MKKLLAEKKDNKGFSLVELIVVILIMAVIAVALAPQVMKWVGTSKKNTDTNNIGQIESAVNAGVADYMANENTATVPATVYKIAKTSGDKVEGFLADASGNAVNDTDKLAGYIKEVMNGKYPLVQSNSTDYFWINITLSGSVTVEISATNPFTTTTP